MGQAATIAIALSCLGAAVAQAQAQGPAPAAPPAAAPVPAAATGEPPAADPTTQAPQPTAPKAEARAQDRTQGPDVSQLERELASILDELIQARTRAAVLTKTLFRTPIEVWVMRRSGDLRLGRIRLRLDGVPVHDSDGAALARGEAKLFSGYAVPGMHELTLEIEEEAEQQSGYRHQRQERFRLEVKKDSATKLELVLRDSSDMAEELPQGDEGKYDVRTVLRARAEKVSKD
jgi:hypothetical protein